MNKPLLLLFAIALGVGRLAPLQAQPSYDEKVTTVSNIGMTVSNLGIIGNSFRGSFDVLGFPSMEYPRGSGTEHIFNGGLWVGARIGGQIAVSTGAVDDPTGYSTGKGGFEYSAAVGSQLNERSSLVSRPNFSPEAVSHQDFFARFTDRNILVPGTNIQINGHTRPLNIDVDFTSYNWNFNFADFYVVLNFEITNGGTDVLEDAYVGFWVNDVVRNVNRTPPGGTPFFNKGGNGFLDSLHLGYGYDAAGDVGFTDSYFGLKFLGAESPGGFRHPDLDATFRSVYQTWQFNSSDPRYFTPQNDQARYDKMITSLADRDDWETVIQPEINQANNRSTLVSVGPFERIAPGQTVTVTFAVICAAKFDDGQPTSANTPAQRANLLRHANDVQTAYNGEDINFNGVLDPGEDLDGDGQITRFILPAPPDDPLTKVIARNNAIDIFWADNAEASVDPITQQMDFEGYRLYLSEFGYDVARGDASVDVQGALRLLATYDQPGNGLFFDNGFGAVRLETPMRFEDDPHDYHYRYTIDPVPNGWQHAVALTAFDRGDPQTGLASLETSRLANTHLVFTGQPANPDLEANAPFVYPNPYYGGAAWEGTSQFAEDRKLMFANLPARCVVRIFTAAGDLVDEFGHDQSYRGEDTRWFRTYSNPDQTVFAGGEHAWDLLSRSEQILAGGIYLFAVEDLDSGQRYRGKFVLIK